MTAYLWRTSLSKPLTHAYAPDAEGTSACGKGTLTISNANYFSRLAPTCMACAALVAADVPEFAPGAGQKRWRRRVK